MGMHSPDALCCGSRVKGTHGSISLGLPQQDEQLLVVRMWHLPILAIFGLAVSYRRSPLSNQFRIPFYIFLNYIVSVNNASISGNFNLQMPNDRGGSVLIRDC